MSSTLLEQERGIRERISRLKRDRAGVCIPELKAEGESQLSPDTGTLARCSDAEQAGPRHSSKEKATLLYDLVTVRVGVDSLQQLIIMRMGFISALEVLCCGQRVSADSVQIQCMLECTLGEDVRTAWDDSTDGRREALPRVDADGAEGAGCGWRAYSRLPEG